MFVAECGCQPGTYESGWMEIRSEKCLKEEKDAFRVAISNLPMLSKEQAAALLSIRSSAMDKIPRYRIT